MNLFDLSLKKLGLKKEPGDILVFTNNKDYSTNIYTGESMLMDYYKQNHDKAGVISLCKVDDIKSASKKIQGNNSLDLSQMQGIQMKEQLFSPEVNHYIKSHNENQLDYKNITNEDVKNYTCDFFYDYRKLLKEQNITDTDRSPDFIREAMADERVFDVLYEKERTVEIMVDQLGRTNLEYVKNIPENLTTFEALIQIDYESPQYAYPNLPEHITGEQMVKFIEKDMKLDKDGETNSLVNCIHSVPDKLRTDELVAELHKAYDGSSLQDELSYALVVSGLEVNSDNAKTAMNYFSSKRFITDYDPCGADDSWGRVCGCDYFINSRMSNPAEKIDANLLSIKEWYDIASEDTRMIEFIPKSIVDNESFWDNYKDFIGKGGFLNHPKNEYKMDKFDEYMVFAKMPERLITNQEICRDLLKSKVISIDSISNPTEELYLLIDPKDYSRIPVELREKDSFKDIALAAFEKDNWNITEIPEKFITKEMVSSALSYDMELASRVSISFLSEDLLIDKIKNSNHQGVFSDWAKSGEHPNCIELEISNHKTVLQYIPKDLRTDKVCQEAINGNPENAKFVSDRYKKNMTAVAHNVNTGKQDKTEKTGSQIKNNCLTIKRKGLKM